MSILNNSLLLGADAGAGGYQVSRSIRLNASDSAYLSRTPASAGNRKTWTWSGWVKRGSLGVEQRFFSASTASTNSSYFEFTSGDQLSILNYVSSSVKTQRVTTQVFRDTSAWYHIVVASNSSTSFNVYVNGSEVTAFASTAGPDASDWFFNGANLHTIGTTSYSLANYFSGYLANVEFVDGAALTPASFGETNATTGQWVPKAYTGSYGTNGFRLDFSDNSAATATTLGKDRAGSNNWTPNNLSVTAGAGNDSLVDTPTSYGVDAGVGGEVRGNYATLNPLQQYNSTLSNGNLDVVLNTWPGGANPNTNVAGTITVSSDKYYWEVTATTVGNAAATAIGIAISSEGSDATNGVYYLGNGNKVINGSSTSYGSSYTSGNVIGVALDITAGTVAFYKDNTTQGAITLPSTNSWKPKLYFSASSSSSTVSVNFGQRPFAYTAPSGFKALCDTNLPAPTIARPSTVMDVKLYTGNGSTQTISGLGFSPDFVWIKRRNLDRSHMVFDAVRGLPNRLATNETSGDNTDANNLVSFDSTGFTTSTGDAVNGSGGTYVAWAWDAGSSTVTNTSGSISSQVRANASAGFSIVTYTGNGVQGATVGHGLGVAPSMVIYKSRDGSLDWLVYHSALGATQGIYLNQTLAAITSANFFNNTAPNSTTLYLNSAPPAGQTNTNGNRHLAYCFAPVAGYSAFGSYTGNGSADGPFVYTGFRPAFVLVKGTGNGLIWTIEDNKRDTYNGTSKYLQPQSSDAEGSVAAPHYDFTSNGFKIRTTDSAWNQSSNTYIYAAFAENPFQFARAR